MRFNGGIRFGSPSALSVSGFFSSLEYMRNQGIRTLGEPIFVTMQTLIAPILGIENDFPAIVFVVLHPPTSKWVCYCNNEIHGLAVFGSQAEARFFVDEYIGLIDFVIKEVSFDEAREIAKQRPHPVTAIMLMDRYDSPSVMFVK